MTHSQPYRVEADPDPADVHFISERIIEYNCRMTGFYDGESLAIFDRASDGVIQAGLSGFSWGGVCKVEWLWVSESLRGQGVGRALMLIAETEARRRGCVKMIVETHSFQAPGLYRKLGFTQAGEYRNYPNGHSQVFFEKELRT